MDPFSIRTRFWVSLGSNIIRAVLGFLSGLIIARGLSPSGYGDLMFLLGSFLSIRMLLDMGSSSAFYTFISRRPRGRGLYLFYFTWLAIQFTFTTVVVALVLPKEVVTRIWLGHPRSLVLLALLASFLQQQVWQTISQVGEASRRTVKVQFLGLVVAATHLALVLTMLAWDWMTVGRILLLIFGEYAAATVVSYRYLKGGREAEEGMEDGFQPFREIVAEFWGYCKPLVLASWVIFFADFADRWLLQRFGGAAQQGYFQIANQVAAVSLLATVSILNVFWKEIAEAGERGDHAVVASLYHKVNRGLVILGAVLSGFLIPWSDHVVRVLLGKPYALAIPVVAIMFLFPIHQAMGQIGGTMLLASGHTRVYTVLSASVSIAALPVSYLVLASPSAPLVPGLGLGAIGMAVKMVAVNMISVNLQAWVISRRHRWKFEWFYQVAGIVVAVGLGFLSRLAVGAFWDLAPDIGKIRLVVPFLVSAFLYSISVCGIFWWKPAIAGTSREEIRGMLKSLGLT